MKFFSVVPQKKHLRAFEHIFPEIPPLPLLCLFRISSPLPLDQGSSFSIDRSLMLCSMHGASFRQPPTAFRTRFLGPRSVRSLLFAAQTPVNCGGTTYRLTPPPLTEGVLHSAQRNFLFQSPLKLRNVCGLLQNFPSFYLPRIRRSLPPPDPTSLPAVCW